LQFDNNDGLVSTVKKSLAFIGLLLIILGGLFVIDGILPVRSHNPNHSVLEIFLGVGMGFIGWFIRQKGK
jgi:uncharacterized membrane protein